jgi:hypothetical protein
VEGGKGREERKEGEEGEEGKRGRRGGRRRKEEEGVGRRGGEDDGEARQWVESLNMTGARGKMKVEREEGKEGKKGKEGEDRKEGEAGKGGEEGKAGKEGEGGRREGYLIKSFHSPLTDGGHEPVDKTQKYTQVGSNPRKFYNFINISGNYVPGANLRKFLRNFGRAFLGEGGGISLGLERHDHYFKG